MKSIQYNIVLCMVPVAILSSIWRVDGQTAACDTVCTCAMTQTGYSVDCRNRALIEVPLEINTTVSILLLSANQIVNVTKGPLNNLWMLETLYLQNNNIELIENGAFQRLFQLKTLILNSNRLTSVQRGAFDHMSSLQQIDLSNNQITSINRYAFYTLPSLTMVNMGGNRLDCQCEELLFADWLRQSQVAMISALCDNFNSIHISFLTDSQFPQCQGVSLFSKDLVCYTCSGAAGLRDCVQSGTEITCSGTQQVCQTQIYYNGHLSIQGNCLDYSQCLQLEKGNSGSCFEHANTLCNFCSVGQRSNRYNKQGTTKEFDMRMILTLDRELTVSLQDANSVEYSNFKQNVLNDISSRLLRQKGAFILEFQHIQSPQVTVVTSVHCSTIWYVSKREVRTAMEIALLNHSVAGSIVTFVEIVVINDGNCLPEVTEIHDYGIFNWPETTANNEVFIQCPYQLSTGFLFASRECTQVNNGTSVWSDPDVSQCPRANELSRSLQDLAQTEITDSNVAEVSSTISQLSANWSSYQDVDIDWTVSVIESILATSTSSTDNDVIRNTLETANNILNIDTDTLASGHATHQASTRLISAVENLLDSVDVSSGDFSDVRDNLAGFTTGVDVANFPGLSLHVEVDGDEPLSSGTIRVEQSEVSVQSGNSGILVPKSVFSSLSGNQRRNIGKVTTSTYKDANLFTSVTQSEEGPPVNRTIQTTNNQALVVTRKINSHVIGASVSKIQIRNLQEPVQITFRHLKDAINPQCVFWDTSALNWSTHGCVLSETGNSRTVCSCDHLTNFALLMDVYGTGGSLSTANRLALSVISYIGCAVSLVAMILTLLTYSYFSKLRKDNPAKILMNLCIAIALSDLVFVTGMQAYTSSSAVACKLVAALLHYCLLAVMCWMLVESFNMYLLLVKVLNAHIPRFQLKSSVFGWGVPVVIVAVTLGINKTDNYGLQPGNICWLSRIPFYVAFLIPVCVTIVLNSICFIFVMRTIIKRSSSNITKTETSSVKVRLKGAASVVALLGLTWVFGIFAVGDFGIAFHYLFAIFNSLQGLFIFVFHCFLKRDVMKVWRKSLPCLKTPYEKGISSSSNSKGYSESSGNRTSRDTSESGSPTKETSVTSTTTLEASSQNEIKSAYRGNWQLTTKT